MFWIFLIMFVLGCCFLEEEYIDSNGNTSKSLTAALLKDPSFDTTRHQYTKQHYDLMDTIAAGVAKTTQRKAAEQTAKKAAAIHAALDAQYGKFVER